MKQVFFTDFVLDFSPEGPGPCLHDSAGPSCPTIGHQEDASSDCSSGPRSDHDDIADAPSLPPLPQPDCIQWDPCLGTIFEVRNISSLVTFADHLLHRKAAVSFLQETSCSAKQLDFHGAKFCQAGFAFEGTLTDPFLNQLTGGVGTLASAAVGLHLILPLTTLFA